MEGRPDAGVLLFFYPFFRHTRPPEPVSTLIKQFHHRRSSGLPEM